MTYNIDESIIARSIDHYGEEIQATVCMEECAELIQAISKMIRRNDELSEEDYDHLEEEVADVLICVEMLKQIYSIQDLNINEWIERKQKRMTNRIVVKDDGSCDKHTAHKESWRDVMLRQFMRRLW